MTQICISKLTIIGSDNGLSPDRRQAIIWTNAGLLLIGPLETNFSEILIEILTFSFKKMHLKVSSAKRRQFGLGLNVFISRVFPQKLHEDASFVVILKQGKSEGFDSCDQPRNLNQIGFKSSIFQPMWPSHLMDDLKKNNRAHILHYIKLCPSFQSHWWIQTGVTVRKHAIWVKSTKYWGPDKLLPFRRWHFQMHFLEWRCVNFA